MKYQWQVFLPSQDKWMNFGKPFDDKNKAIDWSTSLVFHISPNFEFRLIDLP